MTWPTMTPPRTAWKGGGVPAHLMLGHHAFWLMLKLKCFQTGTPPPHCRADGLMQELWQMQRLTAYVILKAFRLQMLLQQPSVPCTLASPGGAATACQAADQLTAFGPQAALSCAH